MKAPDYLNIDPETLDVFRQALEVSLVVEELSPKNREIAVSLLLGEEWAVFNEVERTQGEFGSYAMIIFLPTELEIENKKPADTREEFMENAVNLLTQFIKQHKHRKHESS